MATPHFTPPVGEHEIIECLRDFAQPSAEGCDGLFPEDCTDHPEALHLWCAPCLTGTTSRLLAVVDRLREMQLAPTGHVVSVAGRTLADPVPIYGTPCVSDEELLARNQLLIHSAPDRTCDCVLCEAARRLVTKERRKLLKTAVTVDAEALAAQQAASAWAQYRSFRRTGVRLQSAIEAVVHAAVVRALQDRHASASSTAAIREIWGALYAIEREIVDMPRDEELTIVDAIQTVRNGLRALSLMVE